MFGRFQWQSLVIPGTIVGGLTVFAPGASAQSTAPTSIMKACWVEGSGVIYRRDTTNAPVGCQKSTHREIEWTLGLIPTGGGGSVVQVPLVLSGADASGPLVRIENTSTTGGPQALPGAGLYVSNASGGATIIAENKTLDAGGIAIAAVGRGSAVVGNFFNSGTGQALRAFSTSALATLNTSNQSATQGPAFAAQSKGTFHTGNFENTGAGGSVWAVSTSPNSATGFFNNKAETGGNAIYAESKGTFPTLQINNNSATNGSALSAVSNAMKGTALTVNSNGTNETNAIYAESRGIFPTLDIRNTGAMGGGALNAIATVPSGAALNVSNNATTGFGAAIYAETRTSGAVVNIENKGTTTTGNALNATASVPNGSTINAVNNSTTGFGAAIYAESKTEGAAVNIENKGSGLALRANSAASWTTASIQNTGTGNALYLDNNSGSATLNVNAKGSGSAITANSSNGSTIYFDNTGTGQNFGILGFATGTYPTAQFHHRTGGVALRTFGGADVNGTFNVNGAAIVNGNLQINGNYYASGTKNAVVSTSSGARKMYTEEATEVWFADYGQATIADSMVWVPFDATFAETIETDRQYHVFLQAYADASLYVSRRTAQGFEVRVRGTRVNSEAIEFSYRLVAKRRGYADERLELRDAQHATSGGPAGGKK